jgi:hypothetical protein
MLLLSGLYTSISILPKMKIITPKPWACAYSYSVTCLLPSKINC